MHGGELEYPRTLGSIVGLWFPIVCGVLLYGGRGIVDNWGWGIQFFILDLCF